MEKKVPFWDISLNRGVIKNSYYKKEIISDFNYNICYMHAYDNRSNKNAKHFI